MEYRPISSDASAVPDRLRSHANAIADLQAVTSGQLNGTLKGLETRAEVISYHWEAAKWTAKGNIISNRIIIPEGKSKLQVFAALTGFYNSAGAPHSDQASFRIIIRGNQSRQLPRVPDNMGTFHLLGQFSTVLQVQPRDEISIILQARAGNNPGSYTGDNWAALDVFAAVSK